MAEDRIVSGEIPCGTDIREALSWALVLARISHLTCTVTFNGVRLSIHPKDNLETLWRAYTHGLSLRGN